MIYSRFFTKVMRDLGLISNDEPAARLFTQGMVIRDGAKMSKNKGNVIGADDMIAEVRCRTGRVFELFAAPPEKDMDWTDAGAEGAAYRFLGRVFRFVSRNVDSAAEGDPASDRKALRKLHQAIHRMTDDFESRWHFNTSIAGMMELLNVLYDEEATLSESALEQILPSLVLMLGPFAPYAAEEMWEMLGRDWPGVPPPWPKYDPELEKEDSAEVVLAGQRQTPGRLSVAFGADQAALERSRRSLTRRCSRFSRATGSESDRCAR